MREKYLLMALRRSAQNVGKFQHTLGAVLVRGGSVLAWGTNDYNTGIHAEVDAILRCQADVKGADLYVARHRKVSAYGMAKPCPKCEALIRKVGIRRVYFTTNDANNPVGVLKF